MYSTASAIKNINKFKQWTGEKLGREAKTEATDEFKELEQEMIMRQEGLEKLYAAAGIYIRALGKKKEGEDREKSLPPEILGAAMVSHGGEYASESAYGQALLRLGSGMERIGRIQESYVHNATELALDTMERGLVQMKDYQAARKKLESRRLAYDSVLSKVQKMKKEDVRTEEELRSARAKYEETNEDVHNRMMAIQEAEANKLMDLTEFMEAQLEYFKKCTELLTAIKSQWPTIPRTQTRPRSHSRTQAHAYSTSPIEEDPPHQPDPPRPIISTKYKTTTPTPRTLTPTPLRRVHTTDAPSILPPRPPSNGMMKRKVMRADHTFDAESDSELSIYPGLRILVVEEIDPGWYLGEISDADGIRQGLFPATYCTVIEDPASLSLNNNNNIGSVGGSVRRAPGKPPSSSSSPTRETILEDIPVVPRARPSLGGRSVSASSSLTASPTTARKKPPPPPAPRGSKPTAGLTNSGNANGGSMACRECGCDEFRANVFKKGSCNNCFHVHIS